MKARKTENRFQTGFQQPKTGWPKNGINIPVLNIFKQIFRPQLYIVQLFFFITLLRTTFVKWSSSNISNVINSSRWQFTQQVSYASPGI